MTASCDSRPPTHPSESLRILTRTGQGRQSCESLGPSCSKLGPPRTSDWPLKTKTRVSRRSGDLGPYSNRSGSLTARSVTLLSHLASRRPSRRSSRPETSVLIATIPGRHPPDELPDEIGSTSRSEMLHITQGDDRPSGERGSAATLTGRPPAMRKSTEPKRRNGKRAELENPAAVLAWVQSWGRQ
jgi:hypothetical protein